MAKKVKGTKKLLTLVEFARLKKKDTSYVNKLTRKFKIKTIDAKRTSDGRIVKAAPLKEWNRLLGSVKTLNSKPITKIDVPLTEAARILKMEKSNLLKYAKKHGIKTYFCNNGKTRAVNCFSKADIAKIQKLHPILPSVD